MKKTALFLAVVMVIALAFTACAEKPDSEKIIGSWKASVDMTDKFNESMASFGDIKVESFIFDITFDFKEDGTFTLEIDKDSFKKSFDALKPTLVSAMESIFSAIADASGMTMEELLDGKTLDQYLDDSFNSDSFGESLSKDGKYKIEQGKLSIAEKEAEIGESTYFTYEFKSNDELTLNSYVSEDEDDDFDEMLVFPLTLKK